MPDSSDTSLITLSTSLGDKTLRFRSLAASEELGRLFEFSVGAVPPVAFLPWHDEQLVANNWVPMSR